MRIPRLGVYLVVMIMLIIVYVWQRGQGPALSVDVEYDALKAIRAYNGFIEGTIARLESIADEGKKREFVNALRPALESETRQFREQLVGVAKYGKMGHASNRQKYHEEVARLQANAAKATSLLQKYAVP